MERSGQGQKAMRVPWYREEVSLEHFKLFRADTRTIVGALMFAAVFTLMEQFMERTDTLVSGGALPFFGIAIGGILFGVGTWLFGFWGGEIVGNFNPVFSVLTATNPIAPIFFLFNSTIAALQAVLINWYKQSHATVTFFPYIIINYICFQCLTVLILALWIVLLKYSATVIAGYFVLVQIAIVIQLILGWFVFRTVIKTGFVS